MADVAFRVLYDHILPWLPMAETPIVDLHIRRVLREFYRRTTLWRQTFTFNTTTARSYLLTPSAGVVLSILKVSVDGRPISVLPEADRPSEAEIAEQEAGTSTAWYALYSNTLALNPSPVAGIPVSVEAALTLSLDNAVQSFAEETYNEYCEHIAAGVIGEMMLMPGKPWTQEKAAGQYTGRFVRKCLEIRSRLRDGGQPNVSTLRGPKFGA